MTSEEPDYLERHIEQFGLEGQEAERFRDGGRHWILIDGEPVVVPLLEWAQWFGKTDQRVIGRDEVQSPGGRIFRVSTVFLGMDHSFGMGPKPLLFETMIFDDVRIAKRMDDYREAGPRLLAALRGDEDDEPWVERPSIKWDGWQLRTATVAEAEAAHRLAIEAVRTGKDPLDD